MRMAVLSQRWCVRCLDLRLLQRQRLVAHSTVAIADATELAVHQCWTQRREVWRHTRTRCNPVGIGRWERLAAPQQPKDRSMDKISSSLYAVKHLDRDDVVETQGVDLFRSAGQLLRGGAP
jgi:hypothetical protein